ncbi:hypothetical protein UPYG_G00240670 [Umbra pygmaea]|uniref:Uncharacterized protein n=1 Tax=Umbra pygmaea TaxID=75934 RepID=A0ABD0X334_UMBPY
MQEDAIRSFGSYFLCKLRRIQAVLRSSLPRTSSDKTQQIRSNRNMCRCVSVKRTWSIDRFVNFRANKGQMS